MTRTNTPFLSLLSFSPLPELNSRNSSPPRNPIAAAPTHPRISLNSQVDSSRSRAAATHERSREGQPASHREGHSLLPIPDHVQYYRVDVEPSFARIHIPTLHILTFGSNSNLFAAFSSLFSLSFSPFSYLFPPLSFLPLKSINKHDGQFKRLCLRLPPRAHNSVPFLREKRAPSPARPADLSPPQLVIPPRFNSHSAPLFRHPQLEIALPKGVHSARL